MDNFQSTESHPRNPELAFKSCFAVYFHFPLEQKGQNRAGIVLLVSSTFQPVPFQPWEGSEWQTGVAGVTQGFLPALAGAVQVLLPRMRIVSRKFGMQNPAAEPGVCSLRR